MTAKTMIDKLMLIENLKDEKMGCDSGGDVLCVERVSDVQEVFNTGMFSHLSTDHHDD